MLVHFLLIALGLLLLLLGLGLGFRVRRLVVIGHGGNQEGGRKEWGLNNFRNRWSVTALAVTFVVDWTVETAKAVSLRYWSY